MNLLKSFFMVNSYKEIKRDKVIVDLTAGQGYNGGIFRPGRYKIDIAGAPGAANYDNGKNSFSQIVSIDKMFSIVAVCDAPKYATNELGITSAPNTVFGGAGGRSAGFRQPGTFVELEQGSLTSGGAACHFVPVGGTFGADYYKCFQCGAPASDVYGGSGAYGGGAGGRGARVAFSGKYINQSGITGKVGAGGAGGIGGNGTISGNPGTGSAGKPGAPGVGIGAGTPVLGGVAYYDGEKWITPTRTQNTTGSAYIKVTFLGA